MRRLVSLGDSFSCGEGVGLRYRPDQIWVHQLAGALGLRPVQLARPGATLAQVRRDQLPAAVASGPGAIATLFAGPNDLFDAGYDPATMCAHGTAIARALAAAFDLVLIARWHDPLQLYPMPGRLRRRVRVRVGELNAAIDAAAQAARCVGGRVAVADLAGVPELAERRAWAIDRIHPSARGHALITRTAARAVAEQQEARPRPMTNATPIPTGAEDLSWRAECRWWAGHGAPWVVRRLAQQAAGAGRAAQPATGPNVPTTSAGGRPGPLADGSTDGPAADRPAGQPGAGGGVTGGEQLPGGRQVAGSGR